MQTKPQLDFPKLAIIGKGAIGGLIGFKCHQLGHDYLHLIKTQQQPPFKVTDIAGVLHSFIPNTSVITNPVQFDLLILPVKAYQVLPVLEQLHSSIQPNHVVVLLHNGMGTIEKVREKLPNNPLIAATTSYGAFKPDTNTLLETGLGQTHLGWVGTVDTALKQSIEPILSALLPPSYWHQDISLALWKKLAINAVINPLTAIHRIKNGKLSDTEYKLCIEGICAEVCQVMTATGYPTQLDELVNNVMQVVHATANNYSSMYQDVIFERQSEIEFINGYILRRAEKLKLKVPLNQNLVTKVRQLEITKDSHHK